LISVTAIAPIKGESPAVIRHLEAMAAALGDRLDRAIVIHKDCPWAAGLRHPFVPVEQQSPTGVGNAYREGFAMATGTHVLMFDPDGDMDAETIPELVRLAERGADVAVGSRWMEGGGQRNYWPVAYVLNRIFQVIFRALLITSIHDLTFGFKIIRREALSRFSWKATRQDICAETTMMPLAVGMKVAEAPTFWNGRPGGRSSNSLGLLGRLRYLRVGLRALALAYRPRMANG